MLLMGCSSADYKGFILSNEPLDENRFEYLGDVIVIKEGYYFLWFIPFKTNKEEAAKELMVEKVRWGFPNANGVVDLKTDAKEDVELFDWTPRLFLRGKIIKTR